MVTLRCLYVPALGYTLGWNAASAQRDSVPDPDRIDPDRFADPTNPLTKPYGFTPFGGGEYQCPGQVRVFSFAVELVYICILCA